MIRPLILLLGLGSLAACGWNHLPHQSDLWIQAPLWDASGVVATRDGLYVPLPYRRHLLWVETSGFNRRVGIRPGALQQLSVAPDGDTAVAFVNRYLCLEEDKKEARDVERWQDCDDSLLEVLTEVLTIAEGEVLQTISVPGHFNKLTWSDDGAYAIAHVDITQELQFNGVANLTEILVIDAATGDTTSVPVGFAAGRVLFTADNSRAVVLSQSSVAVVDLTLDPPAKIVNFPLTLDPDDVVEPVDVTLTPDGRYALITVQGAADLYVLDLDAKAINIVSLPGQPSAMYVDVDTDQTVITYSNAAWVDVLEHEYFETETIQLDEAMNHIIGGDDFALLYSTDARHDAYRLDLETYDVVEYRLENPVVSMHLAPTGEYAIALTRAEGGFGGGVEGYYDSHPGMEILDLRPDKDDTYPYLLEGQGVGLAWVATATSLQALVLQQNANYVYALDLYTRDALEIDLPAPPVAVGTVPDGPFFITHRNGMGLISFYDPDTGTLTEVSGFANNGAQFEVEVELPVLDEE